jgi:hypothetical protein
VKTGVKNQIWELRSLKTGAYKKNEIKKETND